MSRTDTPAPRVDVAGTVFEVAGLDDAGRAWIAARYGDFLSERAPDLRLAASITRAVPEDDAAAVATIETHGDDVCLAVGGYRIEGNLGAGDLRLTAPPFPSVLSPAAFRFLCSLIVLRAGGLMLHASTVVGPRGAWVFCGPSESGKTTVARLAGARAVFSDETTALRPGPDGFRAWATPFFGEAGPVPGQCRGDAPLAAILFLVKSARFAHRRLARREAAQRALSQVFLPRDVPDIVERVLSNLDALTASVPCFALEFAARDELWSYVDAIA